MIFQCDTEILCGTSFLCIKGVWLSYSINRDWYKEKGIFSTEEMGLVPALEDGLLVAESGKLSSP